MNSNEIHPQAHAGDMASDVPERGAVRERIVNVAITVGVVFGTPGLAVSLLRAQFVGWQPFMYVHIGAWAGLLALLVFRRHIAYANKALLFSAITFIAGLGALLSLGPASHGGGFFLVAMVTATAFLGMRYGAAFAVAGLAAILITGFGVYSGAVRFAVDFNDYTTQPSTWLAMFVGFGFAGAILVGCLGMLHHSMDSIVEELHRRSKEVQEINDRLQEENVKRREIEDALRASEAAYRTVFDSVNDAIFVRDARSRTLLDVNAQACRWMGYERNEMLNLTLGDISAGEPHHTAARGEEHMRKALEEGPQLVEWRVRDKHGRLIWIEVSLTRSELNGRDVIVGVVRNIDDRKKMEEDVSASEKKYRLLFDNAPVGILKSDTEGTILDVNKKMLEILGSPSAETTRRINMLTFPPLRSAGISQAFERCLTGGESFSVEVPYVSRWGKQLCLRVSLTPIMEDEQTVTGCLAVCEDVAERKRAEEALRDSEIRHRTVFEEAGNPILVADENACYVDANRAALEFLECDLEELKGKKVWDFAVPGTIDKNKREHSPFIGRRTLETEYYVNGKIKTLLLSVVPAEIRGRTLLYGIGQDITERKLTEQRLREANDIINSSPAVAFVWKNEEGWPVEFVSENVKDLLSYEASEFLSGSVRYGDVVHPDDFQRVSEEVLGAGAENESPVVSHEPYRIVTATGRIKWVEDKTSFEQDDRGNITHYRGIVLDVTDRKRAEEALQESERLHRTIAENFPDGALFLFDRNLRYMFCDGRGLEDTGLDKKQVVGRTVDEVFPRDVAEIAKPHCRNVFRGERGRYEVEFGGRVYDNYAVPVRSEDGEIYVGLVITREITDRKRAQMDLEASEEKYRTLFETAQDAIFIMQGMVFADCNQATLEMFACNRDDIIGSTPFAFSPEHQPDGSDSESTATLFITKALEGKRQFFEWQHRRKDGSLFLAEVSLNRFVLSGQGALLAMVRDITERRRTEELLRQSDRLKAVAELASGVAHNFNNLLQIVIGNAGLALMNLQAGNFSHLQRSLEQIVESSRFGAETVRRLNTFAKIRRLEGSDFNEVFDLSDLAEQAVQMTEPWWKGESQRKGKAVELVEKLTPGCFVRGKKNELFEVVVNLVRNAAEALEEGGRIDVVVEADEEEVMLKVSDNGIGIPEDHLNRVFTPFFTTKMDLGTGLGLATSRTIVDGHGGDISVESRQGRGTTFTVRLPRTEEQLRGFAPVLPKTVANPLSIMVVDDMESVVELLKEGLETHGHTVYPAYSGPEALRVFARNPVDIVVCDLGMPEMNGVQVVEGILDFCTKRGMTRPGFIMLTGWAGQIHEEADPVHADFDEILEKPVDIPRILEAVERTGSRD